MYSIYSIDNLKVKSLNELKAIASQLGAVAADKRSKQSWIDAIVAAQFGKKVEPAKIDVDGDDVTVDGQVIAAIATDEDLTQPWVVAINSVEIHRTATWAQAFSYVCWHYKNGTLPLPSEPNDDYLHHDEPQQPIDLPTVGETHFVGCCLLRCSQVGGQYAAVWQVEGDTFPLGEIRMRWDCLWERALSSELFTTPQEAVIDLLEQPTKANMSDYLEGDIILMQPLPEDCTYKQQLIKSGKPEYRLLLITQINANGSLTGQILNQELNRYIEYKHPVYRCVFAHEIVELMLPKSEVSRQLPHLCVKQ